MKHFGLLFPHQLNTSLPFNSEVQDILVIEEFLFFKQYAFHKQKIAFQRASMKAYCEELTSRGYNVEYIESVVEYSDIRVFLSNFAINNPESIIHYIDPSDYWLEQRIVQTSRKNDLKLIEYPTTLFIKSKDSLTPFFREDKKSFFQTTFYKQQRKELNLLLDENGNPEGGKWTFDMENRKKYPKGKIPPAVQSPQKDVHWIEAVEYVDKHFSSNPGELEKSPIYPHTRSSGEQLFSNFLDFRIHEFGDYEDAIVRNESILNHSVLTPMLNVGLLDPKAIIDQAIQYAKEHQVPINSVEGFVRQIIGWREFIRGMYVCKGSFSRTTNFWNHKRKIPKSFYDGSTGILPIDEVIQKVNRTGYCHHIERLMILGNFMLLCEFDPDDVYQWFMELFIDSYDWVMVPNVYGMSQFADGGTFATKPYISGSNYVIKMSNYPKGDWQKTWDGLFWNFMDKHRAFFLKNPRLSMLVRSFDKMTPEKRAEHLQNAAEYLLKIDESI